MQGGPSHSSNWFLRLLLGPGVVDAAPASGLPKRPSSEGGPKALSRKKPTHERLTTKTNARKLIGPKPAKAADSRLRKQEKKDLQ